MNNNKLIFMKTVYETSGVFLTKPFLYIQSEMSRDQNINKASLVRKWDMDKDHWCGWSIRSNEKLKRLLGEP